jgi:hypothetical protein
VSGRYANHPISLPNDYDAVRRALAGSLSAEG